MPLSEALPHLELADLGIFAAQVEEVQVAVFEGDLTLDGTGALTHQDLLGGPVTLAQDKHLLGAVLIRGSLTLPRAAYMDADSDWSPSLIVERDLNARALSLSGGHTRIGGDCTVSEVIHGHYHHGSLEVRGALRCPWILSDDYPMSFLGPVDAEQVWGAPGDLDIPCADSRADFERLAGLLKEEFTDPRGMLDDEAIRQAIARKQRLTRPRSGGKKPTAVLLRVPKEIQQQLDALAAREQAGHPVRHLVLTGKLRGLPDAVRGFKHLRLLHLKDLPLTTLPAWIGDFDALETLRLTDCDLLSELPADLGRLASLRHLDLHESGVERWPLEGPACLALREVRFGSWSESAPPELFFRQSFEPLRHLERLKVSMYHAPPMRWARPEDWHTGALSGLRVLDLFRHLSGPLTEDLRDWPSLQALALRIGSGRQALQAFEQGGFEGLRHLRLELEPQPGDAALYRALKARLPRVHLHGALGHAAQDAAQCSRFDALKQALGQSDPEAGPARRLALDQAQQWLEQAAAQGEDLLGDAEKTLTLQAAVLKAMTTEAVSCADAAGRFAWVDRLDRLGQAWRQPWGLSADETHLFGGALHALSDTVELNRIWWLLRHPQRTPVELRQASELLDGHLEAALRGHLRDALVYRNLRQLCDAACSDAGI